ncbi:iron ABC transporter substrate-binding protein [Tepidimicrobium xylanilyticum]|uniref:Iron complex transport system substrate-binding protein n=1 Tax=Tepidimicrobium xylanilyticum TaxID=1123352 RepID=A0A1H2TF74_9FIRM|nr:iron ABC transporter substrate-binding protein [Tepidimicrobium xylanilyticum]GMG95959.1 iron ABC transporter substrate-binding protein [Tepidimicrobium xylanilyticum]SDW42532.1 iron complex transport system substrate-binding protein [Tepidimicrobium xylanilyticum]
MGKKLSLLLVLIISSMWILTSCNQSDGMVNNDRSLTSKKAGTVEIIDMSGRSIVLEKPVERVVAIGSALRIYTYINGTEKLVGAERNQQSAETGRPYILANPELEQLPLVGEGFPANPDPELLIKVNPDLIIAGDILDIAEIEELEKKTGIPIAVVTTGVSTVFDGDMYKSLRIIGEIVDRTDRAEELIGFMEGCKKELLELTKNIPEDKKPSIYIGGVSYKGMHGIESTLGNSPILNAIRAKNVVDELGKTGSVMIDKEQLLEWDPDVIVIDENGLNLVKEDYSKYPDYYNSLSAVKNGRVYGQLPHTSYYSNIETAIADAYFLGKILYPDEFKDIDVIEKADEIYTFMLGKPLYSIMADRFGGYEKIDL